MKFKLGDKVKLIKETECTFGFKKRRYLQNNRDIKISR